MKKLMVVAFAALAGAAGATDYTWTGQGDRKTWANATNWSPMTGYPTAADDNAIFTDDATPG